ncbi:MAG: tetratricopeptide repeat protein [Pirellula sp.]
MSKKNSDLRELAEKELEALNDRAGDLMEKSYCDSSFRLFGELRQRSKSERSLAYYVFGTFCQMTLAHRQFQFEVVRERAIELIAIFENEEQARKIEPELDLEEYEGLRYQMGACAYEVLAEATGELEGYNSEGMQECLTGGIEVCHRIGKLSCVGCFREYAYDIHQAADDYELARFHCHQVIKQGDQFSERGDRRWLATLKLGVLDVYEGELELARQKFEKSWELAQLETVNDIQGAKFGVALELHLLDLLEGKPSEIRFNELVHTLPPRGECVEYDLDRDYVQAMEFALSGEWDQAEALLMKWHRFCKLQKSISRWLERGIRLVACKRLRGEIEAAKRIAAPLEEAATKSNDWSSLKRLNTCLDQTVSITPLGTIVKNSKLHPGDNARVSESSGTDSVRPPYYELSTDTPLYGWLNDLGERLHKALDEEGEDADIDIFRDELMLSQNRDWSNPEDIGRALHYMTYLVTPGADFKKIWEWANKMVQGFQETGYLISILARLGMGISAAERFNQITKIDFENINGELPPTLIENERLDQLVRKSLQLDSSGVNNNFRAAEVFEYIDKLGEAERCYARAFKLDRSRADAALSLAKIYSLTDRNSDSHYVLDLSIREGGDSPELYFEAAMRAHNLGMYELLVSYLSTFLERYPPIQWIYYYLAIGLLETKKPKESLECIQKEITEFKGEGIHIESIIAAANGQLGNSAATASAIEKSFKMPLSEIDDLTSEGISSALERLWRAAKQIGNQLLTSKMEQRLLRTGFAPEEYFVEKRASQKPKDLNLYHVTILQPLDEDWENCLDRLPDQQDWTGYIAHWGVLAEDDDQAEEMVLEVQANCYSLEPEVLEVEMGEEPLHDRMGVVFQGVRMSADDMEDDEDEDEDDEDYSQED